MTVITWRKLRMLSKMSHLLLNISPRNDRMKQLMVHLSARNRNDNHKIDSSNLNLLIKAE